MDEGEEATELRRLDYFIAATSVLTACLRLGNAVKYNPNWRLQPRAPAGDPGGIGGQWIAWLGAAASGLPVLQRVAFTALRRLKQEARRLAPILRRLPRRWDNDTQPDEDSYDEETRRISQSSWQRFGYPTVRFRTESELRRYLGQAGPGREWHHIVEKRLAGRDGFPPELIHSTDNIVSLPVEVHRRISAKMSMRHSAFSYNIRRHGLEKLSFGGQYDHGLDLIEETLREFGYDPKHF